MDIAAHGADLATPFVLVATVGGPIPPPRVTASLSSSAFDALAAKAAKGKPVAELDVDPSLITARSVYNRPAAFSRPEALTGCGLALFEDQAWTLDAKAQRIGSVQGRHDRHGV